MRWVCFDPIPAIVHDLILLPSLGARISTTRTVGASVPARPPEWRRSAVDVRYVMLDGQVWLAQTNTVSCSDASIAPLVTSTARQLTGLTAANPSRAVATDERGNATETWTTVGDNIVTRHRRVPYATNVAETTLRYGDVVREVSISGVTDTYAYDALGRQISHTDGRGNTSHTEYNVRGLRSASIDALGNRTAYAYDRYGNLSAVTNPLGNAVVYEYDLRGRKIYEGGATYPVRYTYDVFGNKTTMTTYRNESLGPASGDVTTWRYDEASNCMTNKVYADGKGPRYGYTPDGRLSQRIWARGIVTDYSYDAWGSLTNTVYSDGTPTVTLFYDAMGRQTNAVDAAGVTTFRYDDFGSVVNETVVGPASENTIVRHWDAYGRTTGYSLVGRAAPSAPQRQTTIGYDAATGRIATMLANGSNVPFTWSYLPGSDLKSSLAYPNGLTASWTYDADDQLLQVRNATPTDVISQYDYTYDAAGRRIEIARSGSAMSESRTDSYGYNARNELVSASNAGVPAAPEYSYSYDGIGNRLTSSELVAGGDEFVSSAYAANNLNQYTSISNSVSSASPCEPFLPQFDADGNQTVVKTSTGVWTVEYNGENRPVLWTCGETNIVMSYDRLGRRAQSIVIVGSSTNRIDAFAYNGYLLVARRRVALGGEAATDTFVWDVTEPIATSPLAYCRADVRSSYYTHDGNKNVSELISPESSLSAHYEYAPFGAMTAASGDSGFAFGNPFRFSSEYADDTLGLVYYNYRSYNPQDGRWLSRDPYVESPDMNGYLMSRNSSVSFIDVLGLWWTSEHKKMVKEAMDKVRGDLPCLKDDAIYEAVVERISEDNAHMDNQKPYKNSDKENLPLHFNRLAGKQTEAEARALYAKGLEDRRSNIKTNALDTSTQCYGALEQMGQLTHMLQDYYGHGVGNGYQFDGYMIRSYRIGFTSCLAVVPVWSGEIGESYGSPDSPASRQMRPSSYSDWWWGSEHGSVIDGEPAWRAPDTVKRWNASVEVSVNELLGHMKSWCKKCCPQRSIQTLPVPTPSMVDLYNGMVEASYLMGW